jgi:hypothetical protein
MLLHAQKIQYISGTHVLNVCSGYACSLYLATYFKLHVLATVSPYLQISNPSTDRL